MIKKNLSQVSRRLLPTTVHTLLGRVLEKPYWQLVAAKDRYTMHQRIRRVNKAHARSLAAIRQRFPQKDAILSKRMPSLQKGCHPSQKDAILHKRMPSFQRERVTVVFLLIHESVWKYDGVYRLLEQDPRYNPLIVVCPYTVYGEAILHDEMQRAYERFSQRYTQVYTAWDADTHSWIDIKERFNPDLVFFTNPHELTYPQYYIHHFEDTLTAYVQYSFHITHLNNMQYNQPFHNLNWRLYYETPFHNQLARTYALNKGRNVVVTGYPGTDTFLDPHYQAKNSWKPTKSTHEDVKSTLEDVKSTHKNVKRIIWAPHHTIFENDADLSYSTFLRYADYFLSLATNPASPVQLAFKPHPVLKAKLYEHNEWGKQRTDAYYESWRNAPNGQLEEGDYVDLFLTSDAMVFDSASFMTEYLYTGKPAQFLINDDRLTERFNTFGCTVFEHHYHAENQAAIEHFIQDVVITGNDPLKSKRQTFLQTTLLPPHQRTASANIVADLNQQLFGEATIDNQPTPVNQATPDNHMTPINTPPNPTSNTPTV
jgi:CDP-glycerol glycerophosphotransferase (TagB/SpsB family)